MKFNMNKYVTVTLTQYGADIYNTHYREMNVPEKYKPVQEHEGAIIKRQLWELMHVFGSSISLGLDSPFKECIIEFDKKDFEEN